MTFPTLPNPLDALTQQSQQVSADERPAAAVNATAVVVVGIIGAVILVLGGLGLVAWRPDATATIVSFVGNSLLVIGGLISLALGNRAIAKRVDQVAKQTNGINTAERVARSQAERDAADLRVQLAEANARAEASELRVQLAATTGLVQPAAQPDPEQPG